MKPDNELNRLIAERVFKYWVYYYDKDYRENCYYVLLDEDLHPVAPFNAREGFHTGHRKTEDEAWADVPNYCTDPAARETLWNFLIAEGWRVTIDTFADRAKATLKHSDTYRKAVIRDSEKGRALVLATLAAYGVKTE